MQIAPHIFFELKRDTINLVQTNLNHCAAAQDLFLQTMAQLSIGVAVVAEPITFLPVQRRWVTGAVPWWVLAHSCRKRQGDWICCS